MASSSISPEEKSIVTSLGKVIITVCWDCQGMIFVDLVPRREKINSNAKIRTLIELRKFQSSSNSQKSNINPISAQQCKVRNRLAELTQNLVEQCYPILPTVVI